MKATYFEVKTILTAPPGSLTARQSLLRLPHPSFSATAKMPIWIPSFVFKVDSVTTGDPDPDPVNGYWRPSRHITGFQRTPSPGLLRWANNTITPVTVSDPRSLKQYSVASMFYQSETGRFLAVPYDCQIQISDRYGRAWRQLDFEYRNDNNISILKCDEFGQPVLAAAGSPSWMPELLPSVYDRTSQHDPPEHGDRGGLAGSLSLLVALAAFAWEPEKMIQGMTYSFKVPVWKSHNGPTDRGSEVAQSSDLED